MTTRRRRGLAGARWKTRGKVAAPGGFFQRYSASASRARGGAAALTSRGWESARHWWGKLTVNFTRKTITWDHPGPGSVDVSYGSDEEPES